MSSIQPPRTGIIAARIGLEYGSTDDFAQALGAAVGRGGGSGATIVAILDRGDLTIHIPGEDAPAWNAVPLLHVDPDDTPTEAEWSVANAILEKLERYR
ncbi:MAG: hypothetical protein DLM71_02090 [Chloroflexi bacterium]|nr:MAG: hypothetical protein DLM71_02090 [Chloroflexota bacterium]